MSVFEPWSTDIGSDRSANCATNNAQPFPLFEGANRVNISIKEL